MKKLSFLALAAVGLLLGACTDKDDANKIAQGPDFGDGAFIGVSIQMPSAMNSTRANEDFNDGVASEYAVKNATLYIFKGTSETTATYVAEYQIGTDFTTDEGANITSTLQEATQISSELAQEISTSAATVKYFGYVILNNNGVNLACDASTTFAAFKAREWAIIGTPVAEGADPTAATAFPNGLLMTNSPVSAEAGGANPAPTTDDNYTTLVELDKSKIFATRAAAIADPAGCIYVERAAVKITVAVGTGASTVGEGTGAPTIEFNQWQIVNFPLTYYNTRKVQAAWGNYTSDYPEVGQEAVDAAGRAADASYVDGTNTFTPSSNWKAANRYRFVSGTAFNPQLPESHNGPFRTYFAEDPTYNADVTLERPQATDGHWIAMTIPGYTIENTFDVQRQKWGNTTQVCFEATINGGANFYTLNGGDTFIADPEATVTNMVKGLPSVTSALQTAIDNLVAADESAWTGPGTGVFGYTASVTVSFDGGAPTVSKDGVPLKATYTITPTGTNSSATAALAADDTAIKAALTAALANYVVSFHKDGKAYYNARIQHFGEYETPWSLSNPFQTQIPGTIISEIYGTDPEASQRFLGRYGVVRDNWYKLSIDKVMHIGTAEPINLSADGYKDIPDDQIENYLAVHVHIIPWVIRNQSVNF